MRLETVGGVTESARIAMLTSAGRVQRCRAPSRAQWVERME